MSVILPKPAALICTGASGAMVTFLLFVSRDGVGRFARWALESGRVAPIRGGDVAVKQPAVACVGFVFVGVHDLLSRFLADLVKSIREIAVISSTWNRTPSLRIDSK